MVIYKMQNKVNGKVYIGQTRRALDTRIREHVSAAKNGQDCYIGKAIRKYGEDNFDVSIIATADSLDELNELESYYIQKYHSDINGYNLALGGEFNPMDSSIVREHHLDVMRSKDVRDKISNTVRHKIFAEGRQAEYAANLRKGFEDYLKSDKFKEDCKKRNLSPEHYRALNDAKNKAVYCIDKKGEVVAEFSRVKDAANWWYDYYGYPVRNISQLMDKIKESSKFDKYIKGLKWIYRV